MIYKILRLIEGVLCCKFARNLETYVFTCYAKNTGFQILASVQKSDDKNNNDNHTNSTIVTPSLKNEDENGI